jgi:predicted nucleotidyltransferase
MQRIAAFLRGMNLGRRRISNADLRAHVESDVDVLVSLRDPDLSKLIALEGRLSERVGREVELVRLEDAERDPVFFTLGLEQGRVLVDRVGVGPRLRRRAVRLARDEPEREARRARAAIAAIRRMQAA